MNLQALIEQYVAFRQALGERGRTNATILRAFSRGIGATAGITDVRVEQVRTFLAGTGPITRTWKVKYDALLGFFRYAVARGYMTAIPLPTTIPKPQPSLVPYIYSHEELRRLLQAADSCQRPQSCLEPVTVRTLLLVLYGTGLRVGEAAALDRADVDLERALFTVRQTKFFKTRWVPFSPSLGQALARYAAASPARAVGSGEQAPFFTTRGGTRLSLDTLRGLFRRLCNQAGIRRHDGGRYQPRLHDLRHTFAVHRLTSWYRQGADVQTLLPQLSVYLGHAHLAATQVYLSMTPELLHEAGRRFERYAAGEGRHDYTALLGPWVRRFLLEHLVGERNLARNTQQSYRDTLRLLLPFAARRVPRPIDRLGVEDLSADRIRAFLQDLEEERGCGIATRNQRLAAIHSLAGFIGLHSPEHIRWCGEIRAIPLKKAPRPLVTYLEKSEMDALLAAPDGSTAQGRRDQAVLLFLYNTGARADEVAHVRIADLDPGQAPSRDPSSVLIRGKGNKLRRCPLWAKTVTELVPLVSGRAPTEPVFLNRRGQPLTRFGVHALVERYGAVVAAAMPSVARKRLSPHTIRHTTATHLLRAGVDINTIRAWLGHVSLATTNVYAEVDLEMKAKALAHCEVDGHPGGKPWKEDAGLMSFLRTL